MSDVITGSVYLSLKSHLKHNNKIDTYKMLKNLHENTFFANFLFIFLFIYLFIYLLIYFLIIYLFIY